MRSKIVLHTHGACVAVRRSLDSTTMPISISDTIDVRYRLQPEDLGGKARPVFVRNVTLEGVEGLTPLVHFEGLARPWRSIWTNARRLRNSHAVTCLSTGLACR